MKNKQVIEPGVLNIFRLLVLFELLGSVLQLLRARVMPLTNLLASWVQTPAVKELYNLHLSWILYLPWTLSLLALLIYLVIPGLGKSLGVVYLPIALAFQSVLLILRLNVLKISILSTSLYEADALLRAWLLFILLLIPLILTAWQYRFSAVVFFAFSTVILDLIMLRLDYQSLLLSRLAFFVVLFLRTMLYLAVGYIISHLVGIQRQQRASLLEANIRLEQTAKVQEQLTVSRERNRLARELHDTLAHTLSALAVQLEAIGVVAGDEQPEVRARLEQSTEFTRWGLVEVRRAIQNLRVSSLEDMGLTLALSALADSSAKRANLTLNLSLPNELPTLPSDVEHGIYRIAEEALNNVARHAKATQLALTLKCEPSHLSLTIVDNGTGFDLNDSTSPNHFGLQRMRERARSLGGDLKIMSEPGKGTRVLLDVPYAHTNTHL